MLEVKNETLHQVYFILKTNPSARAHFCNAVVTRDLFDLKIETEAICVNYNTVYLTAPTIDANRLTRDNMLSLIDTFIGA